MPADESHWTAETESRLIEMHRREHTAEEMARELSLPLDLVQEKLEALLHDDEYPHEPWLSH